MSKKSGPAPPPAPDPTVVSNAQSASNIATAEAQQKLNMIGTRGPDGSVSYQADPSQPGGYTQVTALSPGQQALYDSGLQAQNSATNIANQQIGRVGDALSHPLDTSGLQKMSGGVDLSGLNPGSGIQTGFNQGQSVQGDVGPQNLFGAYQNAANASYGQAASRLDPQWQQAESQNRTRLANQGLSENSTAYQTAMDNFGRSKNDAYNQANFSAQDAGLNAENTLFGQSVAQGQFHNDAAGQQYGQNQGAAAFNNQAQNQQFGQNMSAAQLALQNAQFGNQARQQGLNEQAYLQNEPLNQFNSLMSSSQVGTPQGINYSPTSVNSTDVLGAYALNSQAQNANYQAQMQNRSAGLGGLAQLGGAALKTFGPALVASDVRLKRDIELLAREADGLGVYRYRYLDDDEQRIGVMAQEVAQLRPQALGVMPNGYLGVYYGRL